MDHHLHVGRVVAGEVAPGMKVDAEVNGERREKTALNHSATHLLHAALRTVLGEHVAQKGSLVNAERLRFDFSHFEAVTPDEMTRIEEMVNEQVRANTSVETRITDMETARSMGAMALFGEKYGDTVRVLSMGTGDFSIELCGGTHVHNTGDIGLCRIVAETGISSGVRRIEALTGEAALAHDRGVENRLNRIAGLVKGAQDTVVERVEGLIERNRVMEKEIEQLKSKLASSAGSDLASSAVDVNGIQVVAADMQGADRKALMETADQLRNKLGTAVILLGAVEDGKVTLVAGVTKNLTDTLKAGDLMKTVAPKVDGKGGGRPDMAQGGGSNPDGLPDAVAAVETWVRENTGV
jgi:Alanyl-tRNA synthetase